jgi:hypothetical protein
MLDLIIEAIRFGAKLKVVMDVIEEVIEFIDEI